MGRLTDTHCHLNLNSFRDDLSDVLARAWDAGLYRILVPGIDLPTSRIAIDIADRYSEVYASVGVHPTDVETWNDQTLPALRQLARHPKVVAIGEIGLDYYHDRGSHELQKNVLKAQLDLAGELELPVILHNRDSFPDLWEIVLDWMSELKKSNSALANRPGVFHSFEGVLEEANLIVNQNFLLGISGPVTYRNAAERHRIGIQIPIKALLLETDAPFLPPQPHRGKRNEPAFTTFIAEKLAGLRGLDYEVITGTTADNAARLFLWEP